jgi:hypothetical protein
MRPFEFPGLRGARVAAPNELDGRKWLSEADDESAPDSRLQPATGVGAAGQP